MSAKGDDNRLVLDAQAVDLGSIEPVGRSVAEAGFFHLPTDY